jgi:hypothetical protein
MKPAERRAAGKRRRDEVPREVHTGWHAPADRADPIAILHAADTTRQKDLVPLRYGRMLQSPFTFYRGSAGVMAADLARTPVSGLHAQVCGDCHLMNFGGFATPERRIIFDINDLDETFGVSVALRRHRLGQGLAAPERRKRKDGRYPFDHSIGSGCASILQLHLHVARSADASGRVSR